MLLQFVLPEDGRVGHEIDWWPGLPQLHRARALNTVAPAVRSMTQASCKSKAPSCPGASLVPLPIALVASSESPDFRTCLNVVRQQEREREREPGSPR